MSRWHIDRFDSTLHLGKKATYEQIKQAALNAGRFSVFEATESPGMFDRLIRDPEIEKTEMGYPWVGIRRRGDSA